MAKKHPFHCQKCNNVIEIFKKGKKHRIMVCPLCGVIATNPFSLAGAGSGALLGAELGSIVPGIGNVAGAVIGGGIGAFSSGGSKKKAKSEDDGIKKVIIDSKDKPNRNERIINRVLYGDVN